MRQRYYHLEHRPWSFESELYRFGSDIDQTRIFKIQKSSLDLWVCTTKNPFKSGTYDGRLRSPDIVECVKSTKIYRRVTKSHWAIEIDMQFSSPKEEQSLMEFFSRFKKSKAYMGPAPRNSVEFWEQYEWFSWKHYKIPLMVWTPHNLHAGTQPYIYSPRLLKSAETWEHYLQLVREKNDGRIKQPNLERKYAPGKYRGKHRSFVYKGFHFPRGTAPRERYKIFQDRLPPKQLSRKLLRRLD